MSRISFFICVMMLLAVSCGRFGKSANVTETVEVQTPAPIESCSFAPGDTVPDSWLSEHSYKVFFRFQPIPDSVFEMMQGKTYKDGCTVPREDLSYVNCLHKDASGHSIVGEIIVAKSIAARITDILRQLYEADYPIEKMRLPDLWDADDEKVMSANNSSGFNYRTIAGSKTLSSHALGLAVDINPLYNPCCKKKPDGSLSVQPAGGAAYSDRGAEFEYKIVSSDLCCKLFMANGFTWGGDFKSLKDYQHFELSR